MTLLKRAYVTSAPLDSLPFLLAVQSVDLIGRGEPTNVEHQFAAFNPMVNSATAAFSL